MFALNKANITNKWFPRQNSHAKRPNKTLSHFFRTPLLKASKTQNLAVNIVFIKKTTK